ncbi:hypothetical protein BJV74DRAFT_799894 [Russula compacta]|nr:hypothetical protein BJV74DRAFT_799894 [Russula compacta]
MPPEPAPTRVHSLRHPNSRSHGQKGSTSFRIRATLIRNPKESPRVARAAPEDDPYALDDRDEEGWEHKSEELEGTRPAKFDGDRSKTQPLLSHFGRFMIMNRRTHVAPQPVQNAPIS